MRAILMAAVLSAAPCMATAKPGDGKCMWEAMPQADREEVENQYMSGELSVFKMSDVMSRSPDRVFSCLSVEQIASLKGRNGDRWAVVFNALHSAALVDLAGQALEANGIERVKLRSIWARLSPEERELLRKSQSPEGFSAAMPVVLRAGSLAGTDKNPNLKNGAVGVSLVNYFSATGTLEFNDELF